MSRAPRYHRTPAAWTLAVALLAVMLTGSVPGARTLAGEAFPEATAENVGMSSEALAALADTVQGYIDRDMAVGAELLVIKDRQTVLHEAFGWRDREAGIPMERDTLFNIRSMTKPVTGAAAQALIDDGVLALDDRVSDYVPGFDNDRSHDITIEQLLTHQSGLPLTTLKGTDDYESLEDMANAIGEGGPEFEPGSKFWYSDAGADTLGAVIEQASGSSLADFVSERLLGPLGMEETVYLGGLDEYRLGRVASLYVGRVGEWVRFWGPEERPFYPFAWGSQSLYSTPRDYARFLAMWMDGGTAGGAEVLSPEAVSRTLTPVTAMRGLGSDAPYPTRFDDLAVYHGQMALLHVNGDPADGAPPPGAVPSIIGYSGSDGTIAWAWPQRDLIILYFTQSRGGSTAIRLEAEIQRLLLEPRNGMAVAVPAAYGELLGTYVADFGPFRDEPFEVLWRDQDLALDIPSQLVFSLDPGGADDERWTLRDAPDVTVSFARDEAGRVTDLLIDQGGQTFTLPKGEPVIEVETSLLPEEAARYLGWYREDGTSRDVEVLLQAGRLALRIPEATEPLDLFPPDAQGSWRLRLDPTVEIRFAEEAGEIVGYTARGPGGEAEFTRIDEAGPTAAGTS